MAPLHARLKVANPCTEDWESMAPSASGKGRSCGACMHDVHDLSELTRAEVVALFASKSGPLCGRVRVRADGAFLLADAVVHASLSKTRLPLLAAAALGLAACTTAPTAAPPDTTTIVESGAPLPTSTGDTSLDANAPPADAGTEAGDAGAEGCEPGSHDAGTTDAGRPTPSTGQKRPALQPPKHRFDMGLL